MISNREFNIVPVKFLFKWSPRYLTRLPCSLVRYRGDNEKGNSIFTSNHELFCLLDKHQSPLLTRKVHYTKNENLIFLHPPDKVARKASDVSAADWRYEKCVTIFSIFHIPLLPWQLHKVAKNNNGELISSSRQFCTWDIYSQKWKKTPSQIWWCYISHPNTITFGTIKCVPSLQEKDADLQDRFFHTQLSPKED